jgi:uncharacterized protein YndB with AHSA1/START domain
VFVDEWDVAAPAEVVFELLADARTYPSWWQPVYLEAESDGPPEPGRESRQHFKGRLPYHLRTRSTITIFEPPRLIGAEVVGDLRGRGLWTLTPTAAGTHVRFDWQVFADKLLLRALTPVLRPLFRWNHAWAIARAQQGLEQRQRPLRHEQLGSNRGRIRREHVRKLTQGWPRQGRDAPDNGSLVAKTKRSRLSPSGCDEGGPPPADGTPDCSRPSCLFTISRKRQIAEAAGTEDHPSAYTQIRHPHRGSEATTSRTDRRARTFCRS